MNGRSHAIGEQSESVVRIALLELKNEGRIQNFKRINGRGIDYLVTPNSGPTIPLEVKSSYRRAIGHHLRYGERVPSIVIRHHSRKLRSSVRRRLVRKAKTKILELLSSAETPADHLARGQP